MIATACPFCHKPMDEDMAVMVDLEGTLTLVCFTCDERATEAATYGEDEE